MENSSLYFFIYCWERHWFVVPLTYVFICFFLYVLWQEMEPTILACGDDALNNWATWLGPKQWCLTPPLSIPKSYLKKQSLQLTEGSGRPQRAWLPWCCCTTSPSATFPGVLPGWVFVAPRYMGHWHLETYFGNLWGTKFVLEFGYVICWMSLALLGPGRIGKEGQSSHRPSNPSTNHLLAEALGGAEKWPRQPLGCPWQKGRG